MPLWMIENLITILDRRWRISICITFRWSSLIKGCRNFFSEVPEETQRARREMIILLTFIARESCIILSDSRYRNVVLECSKGNISGFVYSCVYKSNEYSSPNTRDHERNRQVRITLSCYSTLAKPSYSDNVCICGYGSRRRMEAVPHLRRDLINWRQWNSFVLLMAGRECWKERSRRRTVG